MDAPPTTSARSDDYLRQRVAFPNERGFILLCELLDSYGLHLRMFLGAAGGHQTDNDWGADDFVATLHLRDYLERSRSAVTDTVKAEVDVELEHLDQVLLGMTDADSESLVLRRAGELRDARRWWWRRVPRGEPARHQFESDTC